MAPFVPPIPLISRESSVIMAALTKRHILSFVVLVYEWCVCL